MGYFICDTNPLTEGQDFGYDLFFTNGKKFACNDWGQCNVSVWLVPGSWQEGADA